MSWYLCVCLWFVLPFSSVPWPLQLWRLNPKFLNNTKFHSRDIIFYNRVPKTGSETLIELMIRLGERNDFQNERAPFSKPVGIYWSVERQKTEAKRIFDLQEDSAFVYVEHMNYMNLRPLHFPQPIFINLVGTIIWSHKDYPHLSVNLPDTRPHRKSHQLVLL